MLRDVVITKEKKYSGDVWCLYFAPYCEGPKKGDLFNAGEGDELDIHRVAFAISGVEDTSETMEVLKALTECEGYPIKSKLFEIPVHNYTTEEF